MLFGGVPHEFGQRFQRDNTGCVRGRARMPTMCDDHHRTRDPGDGVTSDNDLNLPILQRNRPSRGAHCGVVATSTRVLQSKP